MMQTKIPIIDKALRVSPPMGRQLSIGERLEQAIALVFGYNRGERVPLVCSPSGIAYHASPYLVDVFHWTAVGASEAHQGNNIQATEILCVAHPDNTGRIWVRTRYAAAANNAFPLDKGDTVGFSVENLQDLRALIVAIGDTLIVGYSI